MRGNKGVAWFFGVAGVLMVLVGREFAERGGELGNAAKVFVLIGTIWTAVAIALAISFLLFRRS